MHFQSLQLINENESKNVEKLIPFVAIWKLMSVVGYIQYPNVTYWWVSVYWLAADKGWSMDKFWAFWESIIWQHLCNTLALDFEGHQFKCRYDVMSVIHGPWCLISSNFDTTENGLFYILALNEWMKDEIKLATFEFFLNYTKLAMLVMLDFLWTTFMPSWLS